MAAERSGNPAAATGFRRGSWSPPLILAATLLVAAYIFLIVPQLNRGELDLDESLTFLVSARPLTDVLTVPTRAHNQPPLFYVVLHAVVAQADEEPALRMVPWVFMLALGISLLIWARELSPSARICAVALLLLSDYGQYIALDVRPYSLGAFLACWSCLLFWRLATAPSWPRFAAYVGVTWLMEYSLAVTSWVFAAQIMAAAIMTGRDTRQMGLQRALRERWQLVAGLATAGLIYVPYVVIVWRLQSWIGRPSALGAVTEALNPRYFVSGPMYLTRAAYGIGFLALALAVYAAWEGVRRRDAFTGFLILIVATQIASTHGFFAGRTAFAFRYLAPAYPALCLLVGLGAQALMRRIPVADWMFVGATAGIFLIAIASFPGAYGRDKIGPWRQLRADLARFPGRKVVFFDVGWDGSRLQYETRRDQSVSVMTNPSTGWLTGGAILTPDYVSRIIREQAPRTSMFFYQYDSLWRPYTFDSAFAPSMRRLGCVRTYVRDVPTYTRVVPDTTRGALVVGYTCHTG